MSNSTLVNYTKISPNKNSPRNHAIDTITIHCTAGNKDNTAKQIADFFLPAQEGLPVITPLAVMEALPL